jgi:hypothetical protein
MNASAQLELYWRNCDVGERLGFLVSEFWWEGRLNMCWKRKRGGSNGKMIFYFELLEMWLLSSSCTVCVTDIFISICDAKNDKGYGATSKQWNYVNLIFRIIEKYVYNYCRVGIAAGWNGLHRLKGVDSPVDL